MDKLLKKIKTDFSCRFWKLVSPTVPQFFRIVSRETGFERRQSNVAVVYVGSCLTVHNPLFVCFFFVQKLGLNK